MAIKFGSIVVPESTFSRTDIALSQLGYGEHKFRFIQGGSVRESVMWPTLAQDADGKMAPTWRSVLCPVGKNTFIDKLAELERAARTHVAQRDGLGFGVSGDLVLSRNTTRLYCVLYREHIMPSVPLVLECSSIVLAREIAELNSKQSKVTTKAPDGAEISTPVWENGPTFLYDIIIKKSRLPSGGQFSVRYSQRVGRNDWYERCAVAQWINGQPPADFDFVKQGVFTEEELQNIESSKIDLDKMTEPDSEEKMKAMLQQFPINPKSLSKDGRPVFEPRVISTLQEMYAESGIPVVNEKSRTHIPAGVPETSPQIPATTNSKRDQVSSDIPVAVKNKVFGKITDIMETHDCEYLAAIKTLAIEYDIDVETSDSSEVELVNEICKRESEAAAVAAD